MKSLILKITLLTILLLAGDGAFSQKNGNPLGKNMARAGMYGDVDTTNATSQQMMMVHTIAKAQLLAVDHYDFSFLSNLGFRFAGDSNIKSQVYLGNNWGEGGIFKSIVVDGDYGVEFLAVNVTEKNASQYRYRVIQNHDTELVAWAKPSVFKRTADGKTKYAYLGKFNYVPGQVLKIEIYNISRYEQFDALLIDWRKIAPINFIGEIQYYSPNSPSNQNKLFSKGLDELQQITEPSYKKVNGNLVPDTRPLQVRDFIETTNIDDVRFRADDSVKNLCFITKNSDRIYSYKVSLKRELNGVTDSIGLGETSTFINVNKGLWETPGKYKITFTPQLSKYKGLSEYPFNNLTSSLNFTVLPPLSFKKSLPLKTVALIILIIFTTGGFMFMMYRRNQQRKLARPAKDKQIATLQLASVRAQLNPHFIFNALAGIQNLMNKNEVENANKYLSRFARLTRNILDDGDKELTTIEHEVSLLTDYLQMEQTRFGFNFNIEVDANEIDQQIEIPAMLLQPFAENAVKHGVSALKNKGIITIGIVKQGNSLLLTVKDNGKGFTNNPSSGMGLKLCKERIALLNSIYKNTTILLQQTSGSEGTVITVELKGWV